MSSRDERAADPERRRAEPPEPANDASRGMAGRQQPPSAPGRRERLSSAASASARWIASAGGAIGGAGPLGLAVLALGTAACGVLIAAELTPIVTIEILTGGSCEILADPTLREQCSPTGADRHSLALAVLGVLALAMAWGAAVGRSRPAAAALGATGVAVLAIVVIGDLPEVNETGEIGLRFDQAEAQAGSGFYLSLLGGLLALGGGILGLVRRT